MIIREYKAWYRAEQYGRTKEFVTNGLENGSISRRVSHFVTNPHETGVFRGICHKKSGARAGEGGLRSVRRGRGPSLDFVAGGLGGPGTVAILPVPTGNGL
jgi:hypothetical protein